jgi:hypothetical protein
MPVTVHVKCGNDEDRDRRSAICDRVLAELEPQLRSCSTTLICMIDDEDFASFKQKYGQANRGYFIPLLEGEITEDICPQYFYHLVASSDPVTNQPNYLFDSVIYLHGSTCQTDIGMTLSLSHELCHFRQYANQRSTWAANQLLPRVGAPHMTAWTDLPIEVEARHVAKTVAQKIFGEEVVQDYISNKERNPVNKADGEDWQFVFNLSTAIPYDVVRATTVLVERHKPRLRMIQAYWDRDHVAYRLNLDTMELSV